MSLWTKLFRLIRRGPDCRRRDPSPVWDRRTKLRRYSHDFLIARIVGQPLALSNGPSEVLCMVPTTSGRRNGADLIRTTLS